jgi:hypothetical protein
MTTFRPHLAAAGGFFVGRRSPRQHARDKRRTGQDYDYEKNTEFRNLLHCIKLTEPER